MLGRCTAWLSPDVLCGRAVYCVFGWCTVCLGSVLPVMVLYSVVERYTVCSGDVLCDRAMYCVV